MVEDEAPGPDREPNSPARSRSWLLPAVGAVALATVAAVALGPARGMLGGGDDQEPSPSGPAGTAPKVDFDGDGREDLAMTSAFGSDDVAVIYGAGDGPGDDQRRQVIGQEITGTAEKHGGGVNFAGHVLARDLNGDGFTDLVADVETYGSDKGPGGARNGLVVAWGSERGLEGGKGAGTYLRDVPRGFSVDQPNDFTLVAGDFDGDANADLVVEVGGRKGLLKGPFTQDGEAASTAEVPKAPRIPRHAAPGQEGLSESGVSQAYAADLDGDGTDDLITAHEFEDNAMAGGVYTAYTRGGTDGLSRPDTSVLPGVDNATVGDVDGDGVTDLVLRRHPRGAAPDAGVRGPVEVFHGSGDGPSRPAKITYRSVTDRPEREGQEHLFADSLAAGDVTGDGYADVAVGVPGEDGAVFLLRGSPKGLRADGAQRLLPPADGLGGNSAFGSALRFRDADNDGHADLAVGAPRTPGHGKRDEVGAVHLLTGSRDGIDDGSRPSVHAPRSFGLPEKPQDGFGTNFAR